MNIPNRVLPAALGVLAVAIAVMLNPAATARAADDAAHGERLAAHYRLESPAGAGPFPAVVLVSGCSGFNAAGPHYDTAQARLVELGFLTVRVDYLAVREAPNCVQVPAVLVAGDIAWVVADLRQHPRVKADAINLLGWSRGGAGVLLALGEKDGRAPVQVAAVVAYYPACKWVAPWQGTVPVLVLHGAIDDAAPLAACEALFAEVPDASRPRLVVLPDAHHGFDIAALPERFQYAYGTLGSNPAAATKAWAELEAFLRR